MLKLRKVAKRDLPRILEVYSKAFGERRSLSPSKAEKIFNRMQSYPRYDLHVALIRGHIVGAFALLIMDNLAKMGTPSGVVEDVAVHPDWQNQGVGRRMMRYALRICRRKGCYKMSLSSNSRRVSAHRFYASLGFKKHGHSFSTR